MSQLKFKPVWYVLKKPRPNTNPSAYFTHGVLTVGDRTLWFHSEAPTCSITLLGRGSPVEFQIDGVVSVGVQRYGWGIFPRFTVVRYESPSGLTDAYFNDAEWNGLRPLLTSSNKRIAESIRQKLALT